MVTPSASFRFISGPAQRCAQCGCDADHACVDIDLQPCAWETPSLCTHCANNRPAFCPGMKVYQGAVQDDETLSVAVCYSRMGKDGAGPFVETDLSEALAYSPELVKHKCPANNIAAAILADCFRDEDLARDLHELFALDVIRGQLGERLWMLNEFQVRQWVATNQPPF